ncbi:hypothetical protein D917_00255, partial [Trichinella nativa]
TFYNVEDVIIPRETLNRLFHQNIPAHYFTGLYYINSVETVDIHYRGRKIVTHVSMKNISNCQGINTRSRAFYYELIADDGTEEPYVTFVKKG